MTDYSNVDRAIQQLTTMSLRNNPELQAAVEKHLTELVQSGELDKRIREQIGYAVADAIRNAVVHVIQAAAYKVVETNKGIKAMIEKEIREVLQGMLRDDDDDDDDD